MDHTASKLPKHLPALDGMRGVAVLLVIVYHFTSDHIKTSIDSHSFHGILSQFANVGWCGVDLFFVLSGFLITGILCDAKGAPHYFSNFWMRRVLRILPLYYGFLVVLFVLVPLVHSFSPVVRHHLGEQLWAWAYGINFYYAMPSHVLIDKFHLQHFWSLAIEEQFYLIWPFVIFFSKPRTALRISSICIGLALLLRVILVLDRCDPLTIWNLTPCRMDGLAVGGLCALAVRAFKMESLSKAARLVIAFSGIGLVGVLIWRRTWSWDDPAMESVGISLISLFCGGVLLASINPSTGKNLRWLFSCPILTTFGFYSYAIYVFHFPLQTEFNRWFSVRRLSLDFHSQSLGLAIYVLWSITISLFVALLSWRLYEKHFLKLKRHFSLTRKTRTPSQSDTERAPASNIYGLFRSWIHDNVLWFSQCPLKTVFQSFYHLPEAGLRGEVKGSRHFFRKYAVVKARTQRHAK
jgi:peptidoglycan/LPS O-acetylase OafA/YrhL